MNDRPDLPVLTEVDERRYRVIHLPHQPRSPTSSLAANFLAK